MEAELTEQLKAGVAEAGLSLSEDKLTKLVAFVGLLNKWNKAYNLTSVRDPKEMLVKHILDSIVVGPHLNGERFIDVGTGPGLPGIPLAICYPDKQFTLLDSLGKRVRFIKQTQFELGITNVTAVQSRVEDFIPERRFDGVLSRAFASLKDMLHWCEHLVDSQGAFYALKGQYPEQELTELGDAFRLEQSRALQVPGLVGERHLIQISRSQ